MRWFSRLLVMFRLVVAILSVWFSAMVPAYAQADTHSSATTAISKIVEFSKQTQPPGKRGQHPKGHGVVWAEFTVAPDLPENLRVGVFEKPGRTFPAWIRFSNAATMNDPEKGAHGMAVKLMAVEGEKVLADEQTATTQDFVMLDHPVFFVRNVAEFAEFFTALAEAKGGLPAKFLAGHPRTAITLLAMQQKQQVNPLAAQYWSTTPYQLGDTAIKFAVMPTSGIDGEMGTTPDYLRSAMADSLKGQEATFDFLIQLQVDAEKTPVDDSMAEWKDAPFQKVATIRIPRQVFDTPEQLAFGEALSFTPWHSLPEHQPLGSINLARKAVYQATSEQRRASGEPTPDSFSPQLLQ